MTNTYYHLTRAADVESILETGLVPQRGERTRELDDVKGIYLFPDLTTLEDALSGWLGDRFDDDIDLAILKVELAEEDIPAPQKGQAGFETIILNRIPPHQVSMERIEPKEDDDLEKEYWSTWGAQLPKF